MDVRSLKAALEVVTGELLQTAKEYEQIKLKRERLEAVRANLSALLNDASISSQQAILPMPTTVIPEEGAKPSWKIIRDVFPLEGGSFTVPEIHKMVNANKLVIGNPDAIRVAMRRHPEVFISSGGRFSLTVTALQEVRTRIQGLNAEEATEAAS